MKRLALPLTILLALAFGFVTGCTAPKQVKRLLKLFGNQVPDWLTVLCKEYNIPIPVAPVTPATPATEDPQQQM